MAKPGGGGGAGKGARATAKPAGGGAKGTPTYGSMTHVDSAFAKSPGARDNQVTLHDFRARLGGTRAQQDAAIHAHRTSGRYSLDSHEGLHETKAFGANRKAIMDAAIHDRSGRLVYISRRD